MSGRIHRRHGLRRVLGAALIASSLGVAATAPVEANTIIVTVPETFELPLDAWYGRTRSTGVEFVPSLADAQLLPGQNGCLIDIDALGREYRRYAPTGVDPNTCGPAQPLSTPTLVQVDPLPYDVYRFVNIGPTPGWTLDVGHTLEQVNGCLVWRVDGVDSARYVPAGSTEASCPETGPQVTAGFPGLTAGSAARWKGENSGGEVYVGPMTSPSALPRSEAGTQWSPGAAFAVEVRFDATTQVMSATASGTPMADVSFDLAASAPGCPIAEWDALDILVSDRRSDVGIEFRDVLVDGENVGTFGAADVAGEPGIQHWTVTGVDLTDDWTVSGVVFVDGVGWIGNEAVKVQVTAGCR